MQEGRHCWSHGERHAAQMPEAPRRLSMLPSASAATARELSVARARALLAHAASLREGVAHFPVLHAIHGVDATSLLRTKGESEGAFWLRWWAGGGNQTSHGAVEHAECEGQGQDGAVLNSLLNTDCHVLGGWNVDIEAEGGAAACEQTILAGSWKILDGASGAMSHLALENTRGSLLEIWNASWRVEGCNLRCAGPWEVAPVCVFAWRGARLHLLSSSFSSMSPSNCTGAAASASQGAGSSGRASITPGGGAGDEARPRGVMEQVAHNGVVLQAAACWATGCSFTGFSSSDVYLGDGAQLELARCSLARSGYGIHFGPLRHARVSLTQCEFVDARFASFAASPTRLRDEQLSLFVKSCKIWGRMWEQAARPGKASLWARVVKEFQLVPPMARPGRWVTWAWWGGGGAERGSRGIERGVMGERGDRPWAWYA